MARMRKETRELRVHDAWGCALDGHAVSDNAQMRLELHAMSFRAERQEKMKRQSAPRSKQHPLFKKRRMIRAAASSSSFSSPPPPLRRHPPQLPNPRDDPNIKKFGCVVRTTSKGCVKFFSTSFPNVDEGFVTSSVFVTSKLIAENVYTFRGKFTIIGDHTGKPMSYRVPVFTLQGRGEKTHIMPVVRSYFNNYMFDLYVRIISGVRYHLSLNDNDACEQSTMDDSLWKNIDADTGIPVISPACLTISDKWTRASRALDSMKRLCQKLNIAMVSRSVYEGNRSSSGGGSSSSSSSSSSSDEEDEEDDDFL